MIRLPLQEDCTPPFHDDRTPPFKGEMSIVANEQVTKGDLKRMHSSTILFLRKNDRFLKGKSPLR
jgi:hypothetical protein